MGLLFASGTVLVGKKMVITGLEQLQHKNAVNDPSNTRMIHRVLTVIQ